jgi:hypothetical protein
MFNYSHPEFHHLLTSLLITMAIACHASSDKPLIKFSCSNNNPEIINNAAYYIYKSAFEELGYKFEMMILPDLRAINAIKMEEIDGHCGFTKESLKAFDTNSSIKLLNTVVAITNVVAISSHSSITSKNELFSHSLAVGYIKGEYSSVYLNSIGFDSGVALTSISNANKMLKAGRLDVLVTSDFRHLYYLKADAIDFKGHYTKLSTTHSFPAMHSKHQKIFKMLEPIIAEELSLIGGPIQTKTLHLLPTSPLTPPQEPIHNFLNK